MSKEVDVYGATFFSRERAEILVFARKTSDLSLSFFFYSRVYITLYTWARTILGRLITALQELCDTISVCSARCSIYAYKSTRVFLFPFYLQTLLRIRLSMRARDDESDGKIAMRRCRLTVESCAVNIMTTRWASFYIYTHVYIQIHIGTSDKLIWISMNV